VELTKLSLVLPKTSFLHQLTLTDYLGVKKDHFKLSNHFYSKYSTPSNLDFFVYFKSQPSLILQNPYFVKVTDLDVPTPSTTAEITIPASVHESTIKQMEKKFQSKFDNLLQAMAFMNAKMDTIMDNRTKRDHDDLSTAASSLDQASKKTDSKSTPTKPLKSTPNPSLEGAEKNLFS
jgi:hypothetical protein